MKKWINIDLYSLLITLIIGTIVSLLDLFGLLENIDWLHDKIPTLTLLLITLISTSLLIRTKNIQESVDSINPALKFFQFESADETLQYTLRQMQLAKKQICDTTTHYPSKVTLFTSSGDRDEYARVVKKVSRKVSYREIIFFDSQRSDTSGIRNLLKSVGKYYDVVGILDKPYNAPSGTTASVIIDDEIIFTKGLAIQHPLVLNYFQKHYDELWTSGTSIKTGERISTKLLDQIDNEKGLKT